MNDGHGLSLRYPISSTGSPKNLFAWSVRRIVKALSRTAAILLMLLTLGMGQMLG